jgi:hypothetical protein
MSTVSSGGFGFAPPTKKETGNKCSHQATQKQILDPLTHLEKSVWNPLLETRCLKRPWNQDIT